MFIFSKPIQLIVDVSREREGDIGHSEHGVIATGTFSQLLLTLYLLPMSFSAVPSLLATISKLTLTDPCDPQLTPVNGNLPHRIPLFSPLFSPHEIKPNGLHLT